mmetsp:Transcript_13127/g.37407  ORF Transcript_13127/g.37407 Transcript_13127/m.37407 type:complete len:390 (-) Transcript_13127:301-1470(-)
MWDVLLLGLFIKVFQVLSRSLRMLSEIIVTASGNSHKLLFSKGEAKGDVGTGESIMGQRITLMYIPPHQIIAQTDTEQKVLGLFQPLLMLRLPHLLATGWDEVFHLHLLKLPRPKDEVAGRNLIPERLANLRNTKGDLGPGRAHYVLKVDEDALRRLRTKVRHTGLVRHGTNVGLEHEVEIARHGEGGLTRSRRGNLGHLVLGHLRQILKCKGFDLLALQIIFLEDLLGHLLGRFHHILVVRLMDADVSDVFAILGKIDGSAEQLIGTVTELGLLAVHHGIRETIEMARTLPRRGIVNDGAVQSHNVLPPGNKVPPPRILDILLQFGPERSVVEESGKSVVNFRRGEDDAAPLAQRYDLVHLELGVGLGVGNDAGRGWLFGVGFLGCGL